MVYKGVPDGRYISTLRYDRKLIFTAFLILLSVSLQKIEKKISI